MYEDNYKIQAVNEYNLIQNVQAILSKYKISRSTLFEWRKLFSLTASNEQCSTTLKDYLNLSVRFERKCRELEIIEKSHCFKNSPRQHKLDAAEKLYGKYSTREICSVLNLDRGTFLNHHYRRVKITHYHQRDEFLKREIKRVFQKSGQRFGITKIFKKMQAENIKVDRKKVSFLFKEMNLKSKQCKKRTFEQSRSAYTYLENKLDRNFQQNQPNKFWVSDVTNIRVVKTFLYLCVIIDLFSRKIIAYRISSKNDNSLTTNIFKDAFERRGRPIGLSFHSDQGINYTSDEFRSLLTTFKVNQSFSKNPIHMIMLLLNLSSHV